jgi:1,4-dihydroxy-2-naphthoate octaprenyltransferase
MNLHDIAKLTRIKIWYDVVAVLIPFAICWPVDPMLAFAVLMTMVSIFLVAHIFNDVDDYENGTDLLNVEDKKKIGEPKPLVSGNITLVQAKSLMYGILGFGLVFALYILYVQFQAGIIPLAITAFLGFFTVFMAYSYSGKPVQFSYRGTGEIVLTWCGGCAPVLIPFYIFTHTVTLAIIITAIGLGILLSSVLSRSQLIDIDGDLQTNRMTLTARTYKRYGKEAVDGVHFALFGVGSILTWAGAALIIGDAWVFLGWFFIVPVMFLGVWLLKDLDLVAARIGVFQNYTWHVIIIACLVAAVRWL